MYLFSIMSIMKRFISIIAIMLSAGLAVVAQNKTTLQERIDQWKNDMSEFQQRRAPEKRQETVIDSLLWQQAWTAVGKRSFVIEADAITFKNGTRIYVNSTTNFISVNGDRGVVQISPNSFISGPNGLGGITVDGRITGMDVKVDKKGRTRMVMNVTGVGINAQLDISLFPGSDDAYVVVSPNFNSQTIRLEGKLVPYELSRTYEGMSL